MKHLTLRRIFITVVLGLGVAVGGGAKAVALGSSNPNQSGSTGMQGTISSPPPKNAATISLPVNGRTFTATPITVSGLCTTGLLEKVFSNNIFVGAVQCTGGSFSLQVDIFSGRNDLIARQYDALDQVSPDSNTVTVTFQDGQVAAFGQRVSLTSSYAKMGANTGSELSWPIILSGGSAPYALSVDWGDGTALDLRSIPFAGSQNLTHVYQNAGVYRVIVRVTDASGQAAFLQLVGVGNGKITAPANVPPGNSNTTIQRVVVWWPFVFFLPFLALTFWLGKRYELQSIHRQIEQQSELYDRDLQR